MDEPYYQLLNKAMDPTWNAVRDLAERSENCNITVSVRSIQKYRTGESVPPLEVALVLNRILGIEMTQSDLEESLKLGREARTVLGKKKNDKKRFPTIIMDNIKIPGMSTEMVEAILESRVNEVCGDQKNNLSRYLEKLIENDLTNGL